MDELKVISDGKRMIVISSQKGFVFERAFLVNFRHREERHMINVTFFGDSVQQQIPGPLSVTLDLSLQSSGEVQIVEGAEALKQANRLFVQNQGITKGLDEISKAIMLNKRKFDFSE